MGNREEFEKWWCETGIKFITEKTACFGAWQARQPEIDALKHKLAVTDDGFMAAETLLKSLRSENVALKAEVERLRKAAGELIRYMDSRPEGPRYPGAYLPLIDNLRAELNKDKSC